MIDIKQQNFCQNIPGYLNLSAALKSDISTFQRNQEKYVSLNLKDGKNLGEIECTNISVTNPFIEGAFQTEINAFITFSSDYLDKVLSDMTNEEFVLILKDRNKVLWVAGTNEEPLHFKYSHIGEEGVTGKHGYLITFFRKMMDPLSLLYVEPEHIALED